MTTSPRIGFVTSARSDLGFILPVMRGLRDRLGSGVVEVVATGMHLAPEFGRSVSHLTSAGFAPLFEIETQMSSDTAQGIGKSMGNGVSAFAQLFAHWRPDVVVVHGDRFDMMPAVVAALPYGLPVAHIGGGEITEGVMDDAVRHAMTKMSHLHFVETPQAAAVIKALGEEEWRVCVCGAVAIDSIKTTPCQDRPTLVQRFGVPVEGPFLVCTFHPEAGSPDHVQAQVQNLLQAIDARDLPCVFTYGNADTNGRLIIAAIEAFCAGRPQHRVVVNAGLPGYYGLMAHATAMIGNSSSGIVEAAAFQLPVVNIGRRQDGRPRAANIIDCADDLEAIAMALDRATDPRFRADLAGLVNPYGDGHAAAILIQGLLDRMGDPRLLQKRLS